jgi:hypothetical protein
MTLCLFDQPKEKSMTDNLGRLESAEEYHARNPDTFWIPDKADRDSLQPGDAAKVMFKTYTSDIGAERIWAEVTGRVGHKYIGKLVNDPFIIAGKYGDRVYFRAEHVIDIVRKSEGGARPAAA